MGKFDQGAQRARTRSRAQKSSRIERCFSIIYPRLAGIALHSGELGLLYIQWGRGGGRFDPLKRAVARARTETNQSAKGVASASLALTSSRPASIAAQVADARAAAHFREFSQHLFIHLARHTFT